MADESMVTINEEAKTTEDAPVQEGDVQESGSEGEVLLAGKYKTAEDLEKGYKELSTKLREKNPEAPESYEFDASSLEGFEGVTINSEDERVQHLSSVYKDLNLTNDQANRITAELAKIEGANAIDQKEELKKLGGNANKVITDVENFFSKNIKAMGLEQGEIEELKATMATADGVRAVHKISQWAMMRNNIPENTSGSPAPDDVNELKSKADEIRKSPDFSYNKDKQVQYQSLWSSIAKTKLA